MTILFYCLAIASALFGTLYLNSRKKKLSDELILEFEKTIKPKLIKLILIQPLPLLFICFFILNSTNGFHSLLFTGTGIAILLVNAVTYFRGRRIIEQSENRLHFMYAQNLFIFMGFANLLVFAGVSYSLKDYIIY